MGQDLADISCSMNRTELDLNAENIFKSPFVVPEDYNMAV